MSDTTRLGDFKNFLTEHFTTLAVEVFTEVENMVGACFEENKRLRSMLHMVLSPEIKLHKIDVTPYTKATTREQPVEPNTRLDFEISEPMIRLKEEETECEIEWDSEQLWPDEMDNSNTLDCKKNEPEKQEAYVSRAADSFTIEVVEYNQDSSVIVSTHNSKGEQQDDSSSLMSEETLSSSSLLQSKDDTSSCKKHQTYPETSIKSMSKRIEEEERKRKYIESVNVIMDVNSSDMEDLGEDEEEWTPQAVHNDGRLDSSDEEVYQDESVDQTGMEVEFPTTLDTIRHESVTGDSKSKECRWRNLPYQAPSIDFIACVEEGTENRCDMTPYMYFKQFVTDEMLQETAEQTNIYSVQKEGKLVNTTAKEIEQVLGMSMHMGLVQMPCVRAYWEMETKLPAVCDVMSRDRFQKLLTLIHFQDNFSVSDDAEEDKLCKLRPWIQKLREQFLCITPEECHAVHEIMVPFKGKSRLRVHKPGKPHKWGFKMWGRVGQNGFLYDFHICQGEENPNREEPEVGVTGEIVLKMTSTLPAGRNHKVFVENCFTSVPLVQHLKERGIHYIGTIHMNKMKDCIMKDENELKESGRGSMDYRVSQDDIIVRWYDNKAVNLISSYVGIEPMGNVKCWDCKSKTHIIVPRPAIVETYNKFMGGVDLFDMLSSLYKFNFRSRRWYMYIWWHTVTVAVINAWSLYCRDQKKLQPNRKPMALRRFQALVGTSLTSAGKVQINCDRPLSSPEVTPAPPRKRPRHSVPLDVRKDGVDHVPTWETRQRCKFCVRSHFSHVYCAKCKVHLCLNKDRNCFGAYHKVQ